MGIWCFSKQYNYMYYLSGNLERTSVFIPMLLIHEQNTWAIKKRVVTVHVKAHYLNVIDCSLFYNSIDSSVCQKMKISFWSKFTEVNYERKEEEVIMIRIINWVIANNLSRENLVHRNTKFFTRYFYCYFVSCMEILTNMYLTISS